MGGTGVIDGFLGTFTQYIDSGFGLVQGDVRWLAGVLIGIDITLAGLFWALAPDEDVLARLIKKTLYIGVFAFIIGNYNNLAQHHLQFFLRPRHRGGRRHDERLAAFCSPASSPRLASMPASPILTSISGMMGFTSVFANLVQIIILLVAWMIVVISFFIMAIQLFVSLIEFKLTTLAGFVLVPFGLFGRTAFLAEKVLGNVVSSGVKILVLAVIVGIGSTIFGQFTNGFNNPPTISDALTLILASLALLGLSIYGPGIANGLIAGGPQLGAGAAVGTGLAVAGFGAAGAGLMAGGAGAVGAVGRCRGRRRAWRCIDRGCGHHGLSRRRHVRRRRSRRLRRDESAVACRRQHARKLRRRRPGRDGRRLGSRCGRWCRSVRAKPPGRPPGRAGCSAINPSAAAPAPPIRRSAPAIIRRVAAASTCPKGNDPCSEGPSSATARHPNPRRPISAPARFGMTESVPPACRRRTGGSPFLACWP